MKITITKKMFHKALFRSIVLVAHILLSSSQGLEAQTRDARTILSERIEAELKSKLFVQTLVAVEISDLESGKILFTRNSNILLRPASNAKLFSSAAALLALPPETEFVTSFHLSTSSSGKNFLWVKGSGDPLITSEDIQNAIESIQSRSLEAIEGIGFDASACDSIFFGAGWMWDDEPSGFLPYLSAFCVNGNIVRVNAQEVKGRIVISTDCDSENFIFQNTAEAGAGTKLEITKEPRSNVIVIRGALPRGKSREEELSIWNPQMLFEAITRKALGSMNGREALALEIVHGLLPKESETLFSVRHSIAEVIKSVNTHSNNLAAEMLLKFVAHSNTNVPGSTENGLSIMRDQFKHADISCDGIHLVDASGISFYNLVTAASIGKLLRGMSLSNVFQAYVQSFAIGGKDGTLKNRFRETADAGIIRAKTGTIAGVSALSGYILPRSGPRLAFSILMQNFIGSADEYRNVQDAIVKHCIAYCASQTGVRSFR